MLLIKVQWHRMIALACKLYLWLTQTRPVLGFLHVLFPLRTPLDTTVSPPALTYHHVGLCLWPAAPNLRSPLPADLRFSRSRVLWRTKERSLHRKTAQRKRKHAWAGRCACARMQKLHKHTHWCGWFAFAGGENGNILCASFCRGHLIEDNHLLRKQRLYKYLWGDKLEYLMLWWWNILGFCVCVCVLSFAPSHTTHRHTHLHTHQSGHAWVASSSCTG